MDGPYTVLSAPFADIAATNSGVVKVFNSTTGELLFVLCRPQSRWRLNAFGAFRSYFRHARGDWGNLLRCHHRERLWVVYLYDLASATPTLPVAILNNPGTSESAAFGFSISISGGRVVVGAHR